MSIFSDAELDTGYRYLSTTGVIEDLDHDGMVGLRRGLIAISQWCAKVSFLAGMTTGQELHRSEAVLFPFNQLQYAWHITYGCMDIQLHDPTDLISAPALMLANLSHQFGVTRVFGQNELKNLPADHVVSMCAEADSFVRWSLSGIQPLNGVKFCEHDNCSNTHLYSLCIQFGDRWLCKSCQQVDVQSRVTTHFDERDPRWGYVYVVEGGGYHKIGHSKDVETRLRQFIKLPFETNLILTIEAQDRYALERELHERFAHKRSNGEWFTLDQTDLAYLKELENAK